MSSNRRSFSRTLLTAGLLASWPLSSAHAAGVGLEVKLSSSRINLGEAVYLQVVVSDDGTTSGVLPEPRVPTIDGVSVRLESRPSLQQSKMSVNGRTFRKRSLTYEYIVVPKRAGRFSFDVRVASGGRALGASPVPVLEVTKGDRAAFPDPAAEADLAPMESAQQQDLFLWPSVDRRRVYVGQPVVYTFEVWSRVQEQVQVRTLPTFRDFWTEELPVDTNARRAVAGGVTYTVHPVMRRALFPQKAGKLTVGAAQFETRPSPLDSFFRRRGRTRAPRVIDGPGLEVEVLPLPAEGQPPEFAANNVGDFRIEATVDREQIEQHEGFTLTVTIEGSGNIRFVDPGKWPEVPGARRYEPQEDFELTVGAKGDLGGTRTYRFLVVPDKAGTMVVPRHSLRFFDPHAGRYRRASTEPIELEVKAGSYAQDEAEAEKPSAVAPADDAAFAPILAGRSLPRTTAAPSWWTSRRWTTAVAGGPAVTAAAWLGVRAYHRFGPDDEARSRAREAARRRELLSTAEKAVAGGDGFFPAVAELVHGHAVARAGEKGVGHSRERLMAVLVEVGVAPALVERVRSVLDRADAARFGTDASTADDRQACLAQVREILKARDWSAGGRG